MNKWMYSVFIVTVAGISFTLSASTIYHEIPGSDMPVSLAVEVPAGGSTVYLSGTLPPLTIPQVESDVLRGLSVTHAQTLSVLQAIEKKLNGLGLNVGNIVNVRVFLVGDPAQGGEMDHDGFTKGYVEFFNARLQSSFPSRTLVKVAGLAREQSLVEIEVTAVRP